MTLMHLDYGTFMGHMRRESAHKRLKWTIRLKGKRGHKGAREAMIGYGKQVMSGGLDKEMGDSRCMQDC